MRGLTSRGVRPCVRPQARSNSLLTPVRRTVIPPTPKGITAADAFTILLPSVLTAAFVFDITARQRRSQAWDQQIAIVEAETEQLKQKQLAAWSRIQKRSVARGAREQRRMMSTFIGQPFQPLGEEEMDPLGQEKAVDEVGKSDTRLGAFSSQALEHQNLQKRFERLIAIRLAFQMLLQLRTARTNLYTLENSVKLGGRGYNYSMDYLVSQLEKISRLIHEMKIENVPWGTTIPEKDMRRKYELNNSLYHLIMSFRQGDAHLPDFVGRYADLIAEYKMGPSTQRYCEMMRAFSDVNRNSAMAAMCENALWEGHQPLTDYAIANILYRHGTDMDGARMAEFLNRLVKIDAFPRATSTWFRATVNDLQLAVPDSGSQFVLSSLVRAALANQQQTIAEAYATIFFRREAKRKQSGDPKMWIVSSFLQSYGIWASWSMGKRWLEIAVAWMYDIWETKEQYLGRILLRMLDFCVACNKEKEYNLILETAIASGLDLPKIVPYKPANFSERMSQIRLDWVAMSRRYVSDNDSVSTLRDSEKILYLQRELRGKLADMRLVGESPFDPLRSKWMADMVTQVTEQVDLENPLPQDSSTYEIPTPNGKPLTTTSNTSHHNQTNELPEAERGDRFPVPSMTQSSSSPGEIGAFVPQMSFARRSELPDDSTQTKQDISEPEVKHDVAFLSNFFPRREDLELEVSDKSDQSVDGTERSTSSFVATNHVPLASPSTHPSPTLGRRGYASLVGPTEEVSEYIFRFDSAMERVVGLEDKLRQTEAKLAEAEIAARDASARLNAEQTLSNIVRDGDHSRGSMIVHSLNRRLKAQTLERKRLQMQLDELSQKLERHEAEHSVLVSGKDAMAVEVAMLRSEVVVKRLLRQQLQESHQQLDDLRHELERYESEKKAILSEKTAMEADNALLRIRLSAQDAPVSVEVKEPRTIDHKLESCEQRVADRVTRNVDVCKAVSKKLGSNTDGDQVRSPPALRACKRIILADVRQQRRRWERESSWPDSLPKTFEKATSQITSSMTRAVKVCQKLTHAKDMVREAESTSIPTEELLAETGLLESEYERLVAAVAAGFESKARLETQRESTSRGDLRDPAGLVRRTAVGLRSRVPCTRCLG